MNILSLDGGGVFGHAACKLLEDTDISQFDIISGTSIGSAIAAGLAIGKTPEELNSFFTDWMPLVVKKSWRMFNPFQAKYSSRGLERAVTELVGYKTLADVNSRLLIPVVNVRNAHLYVFDSDKFEHSRLPLRKVVIASCSAPTYFPVTEVNGDKYVDGGLIANNPSVIACTLAKASMDKINLISLGTGDKPAFCMNEPRVKILWLRFLVRALLEGASDQSSSLLVSNMPLNSYFRWQPMRASGWAMDSIKDMKASEKLWKDEIEHGREMLAKAIKKLPPVKERA